MENDGSWCGVKWAPLAPTLMLSEEGPSGDPIGYPISYPISAIRYPISCPRSRAIRAALLVSCPMAKQLSEQVNLQLSLVKQLSPTSYEQLTSVRERAQVGSKLGGGAPIDETPGVVSNTAIWHLKHLRLNEL